MVNYFCNVLKLIFLENFVGYIKWKTDKNSQLGMHPEDLKIEISIE